ncbi:alcohol dehydrogenase catalytic domain-containing protein [Spongiactinospora sp. TRM90649]|uniref:zinc-dependent alcohol dehydrogenase n=1 Tax=Spongiactinospora sp. TRM90649 TaxID=3031114 RepID=UPI0023F91C76|nr:alcohol dehydrogenase catalytic domain-containing protein [Spongiactinospora sp. TRM90649]MDF5757034.1 alcohol dehydrogenase catalytic domain-containing protein [Spongiactinospora sp. TRM90649]
MRVLVLKEFGTMAVEERPDPRPGEGEALLRIAATGICGSDLHGFTGTNGRRVPGQVMGHETGGRVAALGPGVTGLSEGDPATVNPVLSCGRCAACRAGRENHCPDKRVLGVDPSLSAAFGEYVIVPAGNVVPLPEGLPVELGALVEPLAVGFHAAGRGGVREGDGVLVIGGGPIGQSAVLAARRAGAARVLVSEPDPGRAALCERLGATPLSPDEPLDAQVAGHLGGPADVALDAVGASATIAGALAATRLGGMVVLVGMAAPRVELPAYAVSTEERSLVGSFSYSAAEFADAAAWAGDSPSLLAGLVERRVSLAEAPAEFTAMAAGRGGAGKVLVLL